MRYRASCVVSLGLVSTTWIAACASWTADPAHGTHPAPYQGNCELLAIEEMPGASFYNDDSIQVVAAYRVGERDVPAPKQPLSLSFRVSRSRVGELRGHLQTHPAVLCSPEGDANAAPQVCVAPFEGQRGEPSP